MDEPLAALDPQLRLELRSGLERLLRESGVTTLFVTHDQGEALALADRVVVLRGGRLEQFGTPEALWQIPASAFVASFIGNAAVLPSKRVSEGEVEIIPGLRVCRRGADAPSIALRPGDVVLSDQGAVLEVIAVEYAGGQYQVTGKHSSGARLHFFSGTRPALGERVHVKLREDCNVVFVGQRHG